ncbi:cell wall-binding repeat-containing protein [Ornithinimicrobium sp. LYQ103]|uniref:cell wall-binding repeat-containing protein n=1 Tax=Ornithinimicrobium sp. LYQ103 TaxID=3378796 RepID=UPI0038546B8E
MSRATERTRSAGVVGLLALLLTVTTVVGSPAHALTGDEDDLGARALRGEGWSTPVDQPVAVTRSPPVFPMSPPLDPLYAQEPAYYDDGCHVLRARTTLLPGCVYGDPAGAVDVAVVGDSKVGQLFPALEEIALREGWRMRMYTKSGCAFVDVPDPDYPECTTYDENLLDHLTADPPDLVLTSAMRRDVDDGYVRTWRALRRAGVGQVVALWDSPGPEENPAECVADALESGTDLTDCATRLPDESSGNPSLRTAAARVDGAHFVDLRDWVCPDTWLSPRCPAVVGRAQVYRGGSHVTDSYAATLTDPLHQRLHEIGVARYRPSVDRVGGENRYATAALLSRDVARRARVFVASGEEYADALTAAAQAGADRGAVLLTRGTTVPAPAREALARLRPSEIVLVGGEQRIHDDVLDALRSFSPDVRRVSGTDRYSTAAALAGLDGTARGGTVYVATGTDFPDALAAAAQAGQHDAPVLLVKRDAVPRVTAAVLRELAPRRVVVAGGPASVSDGVLSELATAVPGEVVRRGGANRYETAVALAEGTPGGRVVNVASGTSYADVVERGLVRLVR